MYKAIMFDMDGTLIESNDVLIKVYEEIFKKHPPKKPLNTLSKEDIFAMGFPELLDILYGKRDEKLIKEFYDIHKELSKNKLNLYPNVISTLEYLRTKEYQLFLVTSEMREVAINELTALNIINFFDEIVAFDDVVTPKPSEEGIIKLINKYKLNKEHILYVGDSMFDAIAANKASINSVYLNWHDEDLAKNKMFNQTCNNMEELLTYINQFEKTNVLQMDKDRLRIIQFTDLHLMNNDNDLKTEELIKSMVKHHNPDFIILTGDQTMSPDSIILYSKLVDLMDAFQIPWSFVFGNHDTENDISYEAILDICKTSKYLIFKASLSSHGYSDYYIEIIKNNEPRFLLFMADTHVDDFYMIENEEKWGYGALNNHQIDWMTKVINQYDNKIDSALFCHIPPYEFRYVDKNASNFEGEYFEQPSTPPVSNPLFSKMSETNSCKAIFVGHDHYNDFKFEYNDVILAYGRVSGHYDYLNIPFERGCRIIDIDKEGKITTFVDIYKNDIKL